MTREAIIQLTRRETRKPLPERDTEINDRLGRSCLAKFH
uniref:Uncharacterized protein n=1 Tax=Rhizophora mucronata TaxID=61149 RepID=A0A2P2ILE0_RHIMU